MDNLDKKILEMLKINARESFATIGKEVGLSAPAIGKRVRQMDHEKLGIETKAYITLVMYQGQRGASDALKQIRAMEEVQSCDRITGDDCLCVLGYFRNNKHLVSFLEKISAYGASKTSIILEV